MVSVTVSAGPNSRTLAIVAINRWNRLAVGFRRPVGLYVSDRHAEAAAVS